MKLPIVIALSAVAASCSDEPAPPTTADAAGGDAALDSATWGTCGYTEGQQCEAPESGLSRTIMTCHCRPSTPGNTVARRICCNASGLVTFTMCSEFVNYCP